MNEAHKKLVLQRMEASVTWWLDDGINLLFGYAPGTNADKLALEGNDILTRAGLSARKAIARGKLFQAKERPKEDGSSDYLVDRDEFVAWAKTEFPADGQELFDVWKEYKLNRPKVGRVSKVEKHRTEWQEMLDGMYIDYFIKKGTVPFHSSLCEELSNVVSGASEYVRKLTDSRDQDWIVGKIEETKKSRR